MFGLTFIHPVIDGLAAFVFAIGAVSLVEYAAHRLQHRGVLFGVEHMNHHILGFGSGVFPELWAYTKPALPFCLLAFSVSVWAGVGGAIGGVLMMGFVSYCHQLCHERPEIMWWQKQVSHHIHHRLDQRDCNFGISSALWDHVFGTYRATEGGTPRRFSTISWREYLDISWRATPEHLKWQPVWLEHGRLSADLPGIEELPRPQPLRNEAA